MNYARALRTCRAAFGLQQQELAERAGLTKSYLSLVEKGERTPSAGAMEKLCSAMGVPLHLFSLLAAESEDLDKRPAEEIATLAKALLDILISEEGQDHPTQTQLL